MTNIDRFLQSLGNRLKEERKSRKLSYRRMAQECNIDYSDLSKIEKGKVDIRVFTLMQLSDALHIPPQKLLDFEFEYED